MGKHNNVGSFEAPSEILVMACLRQREALVTSALAGTKHMVFNVHESAEADDTNNNKVNFS